MGNAKTIEQINIMHDGGRILADILKDLRSMLKVGLDVMELEERFTRGIGVEHRHDLPIHLPKVDRCAQIDVEDVQVDVPDPVIPTQQRP